MIIITEDGVEVQEGDTVFNYYDRKVCTIGPVDDQGWFETTNKDGSHGAYLNGTRICSMGFAGRKGWLDA